MNWMHKAAGLLVGLGMAFACAAQAFDVGTLHVERQGERGTPVILLPGLASGSWVWRDTIAALRDRHRVYAVTLAGFDGRPAPSGDGFAQAGESLKALIAAEKLVQQDRPVLVGHSLGGTLALSFAASAPDALAGVVSIDGLAVFPGTERLTAAQRAEMGERVRQQLDVPPAAFAAQQLAFMQRVGLADEAQAAGVAALTSRSDPKATAGYAASVMALDLRPRLPAIRVPVLLMAPYLQADMAPRGIDEACKLGYYRALMDGTPKLEVIAIPKARHFAMLDQPAAVQQVLDGFLKSLSPR